MGVVVWKKKDIKLGEQLVSELTILEWKALFSIKLFHFHKTEGSQDRFHTHAFNAISVLLYGNYTEEIIKDDKIICLPRNRQRFLFIPKNQYHRITKSTDCKTILITGPWGAEFKELRPCGDTYQEVVCGEHRVDVGLGKSDVVLKTTSKTT